MAKLAISLPVTPRYFLPTIVVAALLGILFMLPSQVSSWLVFDRDALNHGQLWRLLSGQFIHFSTKHLFLNLAGLVMVWLLFAEHTADYRYLWLLPALALSCNLGMWWFAPNIEYYVGFSGVLYGLFTWGALQDILQRQPFARLLLLVVIGKASYEFLFSPIQIAAISANPLATASHFFGVLGALFIFATGYLFCGKLYRNT